MRLTHSPLATSPAQRGRGMVFAAALALGSSLVPSMAVGAPAPPTKPAAPAKAETKAAAPAKGSDKAPGADKTTDAAKAGAPVSADGSKEASAVAMPTMALVKGIDFQKAKWKQKRDARRAYRAGMKAFGQKKYDDALNSFIASYGVIASPNAHLMIARTMFVKGDLLAAYGQAQVVVVEAKEAATRAKKYGTTVTGAEQLVDEIDAQLSMLTVAVERVDEKTEASLMVAGQPIERSRWGQPVRVVPGPVKVLLTVGANKVERTLVAAAGQKHEMKIGPAQPIAPVTAPPTAEAGASFVWPGPDRKLIAYISGGVGAAGMLTFGVFGTLSAGQAGRLEDACPDPARCDPELEDFASRGSAYQTAANTGLIIGLVGIGAGAGFYVWDMLDEGGDAVTASTRPKIQVGPGSLVVSGRF